MSASDWLHARCIHPRRVRALALQLKGLLPPDARVLDIGCGDGSLARALIGLRPDLSIVGLDVLVRPATAIPVEAFDGRRAPFGDRAFDAALLVDVLHHADEPEGLLREAARVSRQAVVLKDHLLQGPFAEARLRLMDRIGNERHGVALPGRYWRRSAWHDAFARAGLEVDSWSERLGLLPPPLSWAFECGLHFLARLKPRPERNPR